MPWKRLAGNSSGYLAVLRRTVKAADQTSARSNTVGRRTTIDKRRESFLMNIYVGNLSYTLSEEVLRDAFAEHGEVTSAKILRDRDTGRSRGFGFVEMPNQSEGEAAVSQLNGQDLDGRALRVNEARARPPRD